MLSLLWHSSALPVIQPGSHFCFSEWRTSHFLRKWGEISEIRHFCLTFGLRKLPVLLLESFWLCQCLATGEWYQHISTNQPQHLTDPMRMLQSLCKPCLSMDRSYTPCTIWGNHLKLGDLNMGWIMGWIWLPSGNLSNSYWTWPIYSWFTD